MKVISFTYKEHPDILNACYGLVGAIKSILNRIKDFFLPCIRKIVEVISMIWDRL